MLSVSADPLSREEKNQQSFFHSYLLLKRAAKSQATVLFKILPLWGPKLWSQDKERKNKATSPKNEPI